MEIITPKRMVQKRSYSYYNITWMIMYINNTKICISMEPIKFFWYFPNENTYYLNPPDAGTGKHIKFWFVVYLY